MNIDTAYANRTTDYLPTQPAPVIPTHDADHVLLASAAVGSAAVVLRPAHRSPLPRTVEHRGDALRWTWRLAVSRVREHLLTFVPWSRSDA
jgi:hypothetical protein